VLVLRPGALGDTLLAVPALRALHRNFAPIRLAAHGGAARLLAALGEVEHGMAFDDPSLGWLFGERPSPETEAVVAWMNPRTARGLRRALLVAPSRPDGEQHCAKYLLESLAPLGIDLWLDDRPLGVPPRKSDDVLIAPGSGSPTKNWPAARFAETIQALEQPVRLIVGEADAQAALAVEACLARPLPRLEGASLAELAARLAGCHAYLGNDSGVSHLAGLCGSRSVVLFGPTSPVVWRPLGPRVSVAPFEVPIGSVVSLLHGEMSP
jgi:ADP-heptose:LPS heptosyltransferase